MLSRTKKVFVYPYCIGSYGGSNPEMTVTVAWMASVFYPGIFPKEEMRNEIRGFYKEFMGYEFSDSQLDEILAGTAGG